MNKIVLASGNLKKIKELNLCLQDLSLQIIPQSDLGISDAIEDGLSFVENAIIKARHASRLSGLPAIADDSGIEVTALNGQPGIYSARYAGVPCDDSANNQKLLQALEKVPEELRTARYQCVIVYLRHAEDPVPVICSGSWQGRILFSAQGDGGFGYDPLFWSPEFQTSAANLSPEQKASISHRAKALKQLSQFFRSTDQ